MRVLAHESLQFEQRGSIGSNSPSPRDRQSDRSALAFLNSSGTRVCRDWIMEPTCCLRKWIPKLFCSAIYTEMSTRFPTWCSEIEVAQLFSASELRDRTRLAQ